MVFYYRLYEVANMIFRDWKQYDTDHYGGRYHDWMQLRVRFSKNGERRHARKS
jgi:hypothetical protein